MISSKPNTSPDQIKLTAPANALLSDRDKQHRIHTWLGEQAADFFPSLHSEQLLDSFSHEERSDSKLKHSSRHKGNGSKHPLINGEDRSNSTSPKSYLKFYSNENADLKLSSKFPETKTKGSSCSHKYYPQQSLSPKIPLPTDLKHVSAATKIQASWRGFLARSKNPKVIEIRHELRARRMEHYINTLCHELCVLKEKQKADRKLRELQTEAIRFMWSQIRQLQTKFDTKLQEFETSLSASASSKEKIQEKEVEKESISWSGIKENNELKQTVEKLQSQVLQLQEALLSFSDKLVSENEDVIATRNVPEDEMETEQEKIECDESEKSEPQQAVQSTSFSLELPKGDDGEVLSARDSMPKLSLQNILVDLDSCLTEKELWSICEQAAQAIKAMKEIALKYISPSTIYVRKDGLVSFSDLETLVDETYLAPEILAKEQNPSQKALIFSLAVTMWSAADFNMKDDQAPCLSQPFENLLVKMSNDDVEQRADIDEVLHICGEHHSSAQCNSLQSCASLHADTCNIKRGKRRQIKDVNYIDFFANDIEKTRHNFRSDVCPQINQLSFQLKPACQRQLLPKPDIAKTPHEEIMGGIVKGFKLKQRAKPKVYTVQDLFQDNPELVEKLNILPNQQRKNIKAAHLALRKSSLNGNIRPGIPTAPHTLKAEIRKEGSAFNQQSFDDKTCTLILRWHPSYIFDKHGNKTKSSDILGYRIYVNGHAKGMVSGAKCRALLDGLKKSNEYRIHVCAVASLGESDLSNTVVANLEEGAIKSSPKSPNINRSPLLSPHVKFSSRSKFSEPATKPEITPPDKQSSPTSDVVERVLRRYGIKKSETYSSSPPIAGDSHQQSLFNLSDYHDHATTVGDDVFSASQENIPPNATYAASSTSSDDHITPRTKALLDQLKDELLSK